MKHDILTGFVLLSLAGSSLATESLCQQKVRDIQHEITLARLHDNLRRVNGLERALTETRAGCNDEQLKTAHQEKINLQRRKIAEREQELREERQQGDDKEKIAKREQKLAEARQTLRQLQASSW